MTQESFSEAQKQEIRTIFRTELERYFNASMMYTEQTKPVEHGEGKSNIPISSPLKPSPTSPQTDILTKFPPEMANNLIATLENGVWKIKPTHLLETQLFAKTCKFVEDMGGSYVQEPKNKHWEVKA
jgi:hypothetical protein